MRPLLVPILAALFWALPAGTAQAASCDLVAARDGDDDAAGTVERPLRTPQQLIDRLQPGQAGCLRAGIYDGWSDANGYVARFAHGGRPGRPLTLRSYPGERATLAGVVFVTRNADDVTISDLTIDDPTPYSYSQELTVEVTASRTRLLRDEITNRGRKTCVVLGVAGWGRAVGTVVRDSVLHDCGDPGNELFDHALYLAHATGTRIQGNVIRGTAGYGVHMYPDAQQTLVRRNVLIDNGGAVIFAGEGKSASNHNVVERNVMSGSMRAADITSYWSGRTGEGNVARRNCLTSGAITEHAGFAIRGNVAGRVDFANPRRDDYRVRATQACAPVVGNALAIIAAALPLRRTFVRCGRGCGRGCRAQP